MQHETEHQQVASSERPAEDEEPERHQTGHQHDDEPEGRVREPVSFGMSVAGTVAAFVAGFGILPSSTLAEKAFILITTIALSGAIISGIGAWASVKRFVLMAISASLAFVCLAALAIAAQDGAAAPQALGRTASPTSPVSKPSAGVTPAATGTSSSGTGQSSGPVTSGGHVPKYSEQKFTLPGDGNGCQSPYYRSYVLFSEQGPRVTPYPGSFEEPSTPWDMIMNCDGGNSGLGVPDIEFSGSAATLSGAANLNTCRAAINTDPMSTGIKFATLDPGTQVCMINNGNNEAGNELILVTLQSVSTSTHNTTWTATVWGLPASN